MRKNSQEVSEKPSTNGSVEQYILEPQTLEETELPLGFLADLVLKLLYYRSGMSGAEISDELALPFFGVMEPVLTFLKRDELVRIAGSKGLGESGYQFNITSVGIERAMQALERDRYIGPAPVPLERYNEMVLRQTIGKLIVGPDDVRQAVSHLVLSSDTLDRLGPAVNSGRSLFLYGPAGNGKTTIAKAIIRMLKGNVWYPYCVIVDGQIIRVYDEVNHQRVDQSEEAGQEGSETDAKGKKPRLGAMQASVDNSKPPRLDQRWIKIRRPEIIVGGELIMQSLDLVFDPISKTYDAPFQMKANTGLFVIDDFGRQTMRPQDMLNRWIVPLETRVDYLTLRTGKKIETPFDQLIVFATNLDPRDLVDDAFLRRIRHKLLIDYPDIGLYYKIWQRECASRGFESSPEAFDYLMQTHYDVKNRRLRSCHPRDVLDSITDISGYLGVPPTLSRELIDAACETYFSEL
jgi:predicted ATPase with chaperone activity